MGNPLAKHVPMVLSVLLVQQVVHILTLLVPSVPMPMAQRRACRVLLGNTIIKPVKRLNQLLVKVVPQENTKTKRDKHPATMIVRVPW